MHFVFILISCISGVICGITTISAKGDLLAVIRQDLRRNNDDYVESSISLSTLASSTPLKLSTTTKISPVSTKNDKTTINVNTLTNIKTNDQKTTTNIKTTKKSSPFRRVFISSEIIPIEDKPKHRPIKIDPSQFVVTIQNMPKTEFKKQTRFTRTYKANEMNRKNGLDQPDRKTYRQKTKLSTNLERNKGTETDEELMKIQAFMNDLDKKDETPAQTPGIEQRSKPELKTRTKMKTMMTKAPQPQRMGLVMSKLDDPPMVMPLREKPSLNEPSIEELQAPWEVPRLETTRGLIHRMGLKSRDAETPMWRAVEFDETSKPVNKLQVVTKVNKNKAQAIKHEASKSKADSIRSKAEAKNIVRTETKLRQKSYDLDRINELKMKLREGLKLSSLPPGDLLDLWPARGPMVHAMRLKNRLCQRSVLLNEGPKYDSKGSTYMPRFKPRLYGKKKLIDFHQTKPPILVLPRCCNCCRKSVLGCE